MSEEIFHISSVFEPGSTLRHYGVKGMRWGHRKPPTTRDVNIARKNGVAKFSLTTDIPVPKNYSKRGTDALFSDPKAMRKLQEVAGLMDKKMGETDPYLVDFSYAFGYEANPRTNTIRANFYFKDASKGGLTDRDKNQFNES